MRVNCVDCKDKQCEDHGKEIEHNNESMCFIGANNPSKPEAEPSDTNAMLCGKPTKKQIRIACNMMHQGFSHAGPVARAKTKSEAVKWLEIWQQVLST